MPREQVRFTREDAKEFCCKVIDEIYDHYPTEYTLELSASINSIPEYRIHCDGYAKICVYSPEEKEEE